MSSSNRIKAFLENLKKIRDLPNSIPENLVSQALQVLPASEYVLASIESQPELLIQLSATGQLDRAPTVEEFDHQLCLRLLDKTSEDQLHQQLRLFRKEQMIRIIWRDLSGIASLDETLASLSALADVCIQQALNFLSAQLCEKHGTPRDGEGNAQQLVVIGMGKLGACELNMSSDIDLVYTFPSIGQTDGGRQLSNDQFFTRLCQKLTQALNTRDANGFVFRVDTRLRPFGTSGPLAGSFDFMEQYYQSQAREWERYAMVKARIVAGDKHAGEEFIRMLNPFVYRRYLDFGAIESLRNMKQMINTELKRRTLRDNVKLGPGGIREIEFIGQAFQLIRGGRDPDLQIRPIQTVLQRLAEKGLIPENARDELISAYRFLRLTENRIQAWRDEQTHLLPEDDEGMLRIAISMGFDEIDSFIAELAEHRSRVQYHFEQLFNEPAQQQDDIPALAQVWLNETDNAAQMLSEAGFEDTQAVLKMINNLRDSRSLHIAGERGRLILNQLIPRFLAQIPGSCDNPEETFERLCSVLETIASRTAYLSLLVENHNALHQLIILLSNSPWFMQWIVRQPVLLDTLIDPRQLYHPLDKDELHKDLSDLLVNVAGDLEQEMETLRYFVAANRLRVAAADVSGIIPLMTVSDYLTAIAEVTLEAALSVAWRDLVHRHGKPGGIQGTGFTIIAYGKLGGIELGYGSDLDLVFLHNAPGNSVTDGDRQVAADVFYARLAQRIIHILSARTPSGQLYEVDMRLRPNGNAGMLVSSLHAYETYQQQQAWVWEHQALVRARAITGDPSVIDSFDAIRVGILARQRDTLQLKEEVIKMREKMRAKLDKSNATQFDLKQGRGGITDIEFLVQYFILKHTHQKTSLCHFSDNIRQLEALEKHQLMDEHAAERLAGIYRALRASQHRLALQEKAALVPPDALQEERNIVVETWKQVMETKE